MDDKAARRAELRDKIRRGELPSEDEAVELLEDAGLLLPGHKGREFYQRAWRSEAKRSKRKKRKQARRSKQRNRRK